MEKHKANCGPDRQTDSYRNPTEVCVYESVFKAEPMSQLVRLVCVQSLQQLRFFRNKHRFLLN